VEVWETSYLRRLRLGEEKKKIEETTGKNIMSASATQGGHNKTFESRQGTEISIRR